MAPRGNDIIASYHQRLREEADRQHMIQGCQFCDETNEGTFGEMRTWALQHRLEKHPDVTPAPRTKRRLGLPRQVGARSLDENLASARAQGGAGWMTDDLTPAV